MAIAAKARNPLLPDVPTFERSRESLNSTKKSELACLDPRVCRTKSLGGSLPKSVQFFASEMCKIDYEERRTAVSPRHPRVPQLR